MCCLPLLYSCSLVLFLINYFVKVDLDQKKWLSQEDCEMGMLSLLGYTPSKSEIIRHFEKATTGVNNVNG